MEPLEACMAEVSQCKHALSQLEEEDQLYQHRLFFFFFSNHSFCLSALVFNKLLRWNSF